MARPTSRWWALFEQSQVVDAGGLDRAGVGGLDRGVDVAADVVRDGPAHHAALVFDLEDGQVERGEQHVDGAPDERGVDVVAVAVQRDRGEGGHLALLPPQERAPQLGRVRPRRGRMLVGVVALGGRGAGLRTRGAAILLVAPRGEQPVQLGQRLAPAAGTVCAGVDLDQELVADGAVPLSRFSLLSRMRDKRDYPGNLWLSRVFAVSAGRSGRALLDLVIPSFRCQRRSIPRRGAVPRDNYLSPASCRIRSSFPFQIGAGSGVALAAFWIASRTIWLSAEA